MAVCDLKPRSGAEGQLDARGEWSGGVVRRQTFALRLLAVAAAASAVMLLQTLPTHAQRLPPSECLKPADPLFKMPELVSQNGKLRGTIRLADELRRLNDGSLGGECAHVYLRFFEGVGAVLPAGSAPPAPSRYTDPVPGPTLRARVGDLVQLTFLNQVNPLNYGGTLDRGDDAGACDQFTVGSDVFASTRGYPANVRDSFPNCFHGSSTANIHFHGTHTNPNSTGDNVFLQIRPSPRAGGQPIVTAESVAAPFERFFNECEGQLKGNVLSEWPYTWNKLPSLAGWTQEQEKLLKAYDAGTPPYFPPPKPPGQQLWEENKKQIDGNRWPQYYVGAYPYCFQLPDYTAANWPAPPGSGVKMGQAPGTHWYHAHKHGSTALNVANGMTGAFIIEGKYDDDLNEFYGTVGTPPVPWTRAQPTLVINQLGGTPNLARNRGSLPQPLSVNGKLEPQMTMRPGEVQLWRIVNTSSRSSAYFFGPPKRDLAKKEVDPKTDFEWRQLAQDGVQFADVNYRKSHNVPILLAPGNRADLLVKAPTNPKADAYDVKVAPIVARVEIAGAEPGVTLMSVLVSGTPPENQKQRQFIPRAPIPPPCLADITGDEVRYSPRRPCVFESKGQGHAPQHTINGEQFSENNLGVTVFLNTVEEWKIVNTTNTTTGPANIDHPFHIHINPFQVVEVFDPNEKIPDPSNPGQLLEKYVTDPSALAFPKLQCLLNLTDPDTWKDCHNAKQRDRIWWDVFPIPTGRAITMGQNTVSVPGFFRMRSRFVDYPGLWVIHCHILAHEDRGMMTIVQVAPPLVPGVRHH
jgi:FtsP/CotA-like multicopper oxidase with cupredoxin domain